MPHPNTNDKLVFEMALKYSGVTSTRMQRRINQLWKARYTCWGLLIATGAFFLKADGVASGSRCAVKLVVPFLAIAIAMFHGMFELRQEAAIRQERARAYQWLDLAESIASTAANATGWPMPPAPSKLADSKPAVPGMRLWMLSYVFAITIFLLLWL